MNALSLGNDYKLHGSEKSPLHTGMDFGVEELSRARFGGRLEERLGWLAGSLSHFLISSFDPR